MQYTFVSSAQPGPRENEDFVVASADWVLVLDGATPRRGVDSGCRHGVSWVTRRLAALTTTVLMNEPDCSLGDGLAEAIRALRRCHGPSCDVDNPDSPSATVSLLRHRADVVDYLVLGDSPLILEVRGEVTPIVDERVNQLRDYSVQGVRASRNQPDGFWIASTCPEAALNALAGSLPASEVSRAAVMTDGVSRYVERFELGSWRDLLDELSTSGPLSVIARVRAAEKALPEFSEQPNGRPLKRHDDATAVYLEING
ncbi:hypothetical protein FB565_008592 [Actinoplanes lutulentus]|uniref:Protein phosphatase 2C-like protein n=1 Tax=Actinoplanes lutulentus TaxID=1287878 RepID=A0A327ZBC5_9ACTN|nr:protein phosphatase 2C domain-containing protein [Actinoplanes lutulentus]MBB2948806.1 hypothetical protein [Actinoplanes lutulentus]RAK29718.1 protein phosphatase 2C-like protein [Actinoplanes lutulentus]